MNNLLTIQFIKPGLQTSVQDQGRAGHQQAGVPVGGVLDRQAAKTANSLVDNPASNPLLEITLIGPKIKFDGPCQIAICGANLSPKVNGQPILMYQTIEVSKGSILSFGRALQGCRSYLAIRGQWQLRSWLGSTSAASQNGEALTPDSILTQGSTLNIQTSPAIPQRVYHDPPNYSSPLQIRVLPGPEFEYFSNYFVAHFFSRHHRIHPDSNRMGYRLSYQAERFSSPFELISSAVLPGTIQITHAGQPIILMADAQTTGGYCRLANVIEEDLDLLAQTKPGDELALVLI